EPKEQGYETFVVTPKEISTTLYFSGTLNPISMTNVVTPVEGIVVRKLFDYGQRIRKSQPLLKIDSEKVQTEFNTALTVFLEAKDKLNTESIGLQSTKALNKLGEASGDE